MVLKLALKSERSFDTRVLGKEQLPANCAEDTGILYNELLMIAISTRAACSMK